MSQGRISYSRVFAVALILSGFSGAGFFAGRPGSSDVDDNSAKLSDLKTSHRLALKEISSLKNALIEQSNEKDEVRAALSLRQAFTIVSPTLEPAMAPEKIAYELALGNVVAIVLPPEQSAAVPINTAFELALQNALTIVSLPDDGHFAANDTVGDPVLSDMVANLLMDNVDLPDARIAVSDYSGSMGQRDFSNMSVSPNLVAPVIFRGVNEELWNKFGAPVWYGQPEYSGLPIKRGLIPTGGDVFKFFGGLTEVEFRTREIRCLAKAIYHESRGEVQKGQFAVAQTIMNRVRDGFFPDTICGVIYENSHRRNKCQFSFACDGVSDKPKDKKRWQIALENARLVAAGKVWLEDIGYASHYHATYVRPVWRRYMHRIKRIGIHIFYRAKFLPLPEEIALRAPKKNTEKSN